jgi:hypothetical protein
LQSLGLTLLQIYAVKGLAEALRAAGTEEAALAEAEKDFELAATQVLHDAFIVIVNILVCGFATGRATCAGAAGFDPDGAGALGLVDGLLQHPKLWQIEGDCDRIRHRLAVTTSLGLNLLI